MPEHESFEDVMFSQWRITAARIIVARLATPTLETVQTRNEIPQRPKDSNGPLQKPNIKTPPLAEPYASRTSCGEGTGVLAPNRH